MEPLGWVILGVVAGLLLGALRRREVRPVLPVVRRVPRVRRG
jgi:hypothetical protein